MMRSMFSGVSGLRVHQTRMDVIANNISNVNTVGYKGSRATFSEIFSQTVSGASAANDATGRAGTNPMQIGLGVNMGSIDKIMNPGVAERTDYWSDMMIEGDGFFIVSDATGQYFTRAGNFAFNLDDGYFSLNGMKLNGWDTVAEIGSNQLPTGNQVIQKGQVEPLQIDGDKIYMPPVKTTGIKFTGNLDPDAGADGILRTINFFDSIGNKYSTDLTFTKGTSADGLNTPWTVAPSTTGGAVYCNGERVTGATIALAPAELTFNASGYLTAPALNETPNQITTGIQGITMTVTVTPATNIPTGAAFGVPAGGPNAAPVAGTGQIALDLTGITQFKQQTTSIKGDVKDGNEAGFLSNMSVGSSGIVTGFYSNGQQKTLCQVPVADFPNPAGLEKIGNNLFLPTPNSGEFDGVGTDGVIRAGNLEMSNVDLAQEFTVMITTQRGFQANSRIITTSDEMLQELVNLKR